ncbi:hypothetical protein [Paenibacillus sp. FSL R7-0337]|uniref:hypothetical protein n=1 Tax=Paenibacillus sp. FSL R7-0337 TaxID=1926588 RepID=UPI00096D5EBD|nr:hypothetical protein [Paenibacillus sp. FSL R7-0337]OMF88757.1 hypothetical protein BK147_26495 [Paenibacillus sp. FSL R7-0337]
MTKLSELNIYNAHPWAVPVVPDVTDPYFAQPMPWQFTEPLLELIKQMFTEVENFFKSRNLPVEIAIYEVKDVLDVSTFRV